MTRRRIKIDVAEGVGVVRGWGAGDLIEDAGIKPFFARGGWMVDEHRLPDLLAELERRHIAVEVTPNSRSVGTCTSRATPLEDRHAGLPVDEPLWPDGGGS